MKEAMPYWRKSHKCYYLHLRSTAFGAKKTWTVRLCPSKAEAKKLRNQIMAGQPFQQGKSWKVWDGSTLTDLGAGDATIAAERLASLKVSGEPTENDMLVVEVLDRFLKHHREHSAAGTVKFYEEPIQSFKAFLPSGLRLSQLKVSHGEDWLQTRRTWKHSDRPTSDSQLHNLARAIKEPFSWAWKREDTTFYPLRGLEKAKQDSCKLVLTIEQWATIIGAVKDDEFLDVLWFAWDTGARPFEIRILESRHFQREKRRIVIPWKEAKQGRKTKRDRVIRLSDRAYAIAERLALKYPEGAIFRNTDGAPWRKDAFVLRCRRLSDKLGFKFTAKTLRHTFCTRLAESQVSQKAAADLMGHIDTSMVDRVYSHLSEDHLEGELRKLGGGAA